MITFTGLTFSGNPDATEALGAKRTIALENARITLENQRLAALTPPGTPLPLWANGTNAEIKASYIAILLQGVQNTHVSYVQQAAAPEAIKDFFTEAELQIIRANLIQRRQAGASAFEIVSDTAA